MGAQWIEIIQKSWWFN